MKQLALVRLVAIALLGLIAAFNSPAVDAQQPVPEELPAQTPSALRGQAIYEARCIRCHGPNGAGEGEMSAQLPATLPSFADVEHMREVTPAEYFNIITNGNMQNLMPPWGEELSAQERWDVLFYAWSFGTTAERVQAGEKVYAEECAACHAENGAQVDTIDLSDQVTMAVLSQADLTAGVSEGHAEVDWKDTLSDDDRWAVVDYVRTFTYDTRFEVEKATGNGVISGQVIAGTPGAEVEIEGVEVTIFPFVDETSLTPITTTTKPDGSFQVEDLPTESRQYGIQANYKGVDYFYPELVDLTGNPSASVAVEVYETTEDDSAVSVERNHIIIDFANNRLQVAELYIFRNSGDRTYVGAGETLRFALPEGAQTVQFDDPRMNQSTRLEENQAVDTLPVPPGDRQVLLSYAIPYDGSAATYQKDIVYATQNLNVLIADAGAEIVDAGFLEKSEPVATQTNTQFLNYSTRDVPAGEQIALKLSSLPQGTTTGVGSGSSISVPPDRSGTLRWLGLGFVAIALVFVVAYPALRPRLLPEEALADDSTSEAVLRRQRQMLLEELADLDDEYEASEVAENIYLDARAEIKADLIDVMRRLQDLEERES